MNNRQSLWVKILSLILCFAMLVSVIVLIINYKSYADKDLNSKKISVRILSENDHADSFSFISPKGFSIGYMNDDKFKSLFETDTKELFISNDGNLVRKGNELIRDDNGVISVGKYHIQLTYYAMKIDQSSGNDNPVYINGQPVDGPTHLDFTEETLEEAINDLYASGILDKYSLYAFPAFIDGNYYIRIGSYSDINTAENDVKKLEDDLVLEYEIVSENENAYSVIDASEYKVLYECSFTDNKELTVLPDYSDEINYTSTFFDTRFNGDFILKKGKNDNGTYLEIKNLLSIEDYVCCVLSLEVSPDWNIEALKAAAVLIRTYSEYNLDSHSYDGFNLCSGSHCQNYKGANYVNDSVKSAVSSTKGEVLKYEDEICVAIYNSFFGDVGVSSKDAVNIDLPYLKPKPSPWENIGKTESGETVKEVTPYEMYVYLSDRGYSDLRGSITNIEVVTRANDSTYVTLLKFTDNFGNTVEISGCENIRRVLSSYVTSANFYVSKAQKEFTVTNYYPVENSLEYTKNNEIRVAKGTYGNFVFISRGIGTGLGVSLFSAKQLAENSYGYKDILLYFYEGAQVTLN